MGLMISHEKESDTDLPTVDDAPQWRTGDTSLWSKVRSGSRGLQRAIQTNSSYFAHAYRGFLIILSGAILGISPIGWCFLTIAAALVLTSELFHTAIEAIAASVATESNPQLRDAREIASGAVLVASVTSAVITITVLVTRLGVLLDW